MTRYGLGLPLYQSGGSVAGAKLALAFPPGGRFPAARQTGS